jgi:drug/metabolite transporter (DMT)-like permease
MSWFALALLIASAFLHMGWNLLMKQTADRYVVTWWALLIGSLCFLPLAVAARAELRPVWGYALAGACFQVLYYIILGFAYGSGDFSLVYPLARGTAPVLIALWAVLFLGESLSWAGLIGLGAIVLGIVLIGAGAWRNSPQRSLKLSWGTVAPFLIALCISGYSVIDGAAVKQAPPLPYTALGLGLSVVLMTPLVWTRYGWGTLKRVGQEHWWRITLIGLATFAAYGLTLTAYRLAHVSYVGAVREVSIVLAALVGWLWLGEPFGLTRTVGALVVAAGILVVTVVG